VILILTLNHFSNHDVIPIPNLFDFTQHWLVQLPGSRHSLDVFPSNIPRLPLLSLNVKYFLVISGWG